MADNIKISDLDALTSAQNSTIVPVVDGGTTKKMSLSTLKTHLTASFATPAQLLGESSALTATINALTTDDISEGSNLYYTNARFDERIGDLNVITSSEMVDALQIQNLNSAVLGALGGTDIISGSLTTSSIQDFPTEVSRSAAAAGFGVGGGGGSTAWGDITSKPSGLVSSSAQTIQHINTINVYSGSTDFDTAVSASAAAAGFGAGGGATGSGTDYISNISFVDSTLTFTGVGSAFNSTIDLSTGDLATQTDLSGLLGLGTYLFDSASFATRLDAGGGGGGSVPTGTISSSAQVYATFSGSNLVSSSAQIEVVNADLTGLTIDDIGNGVTNRYYSNTLVKDYLDSIDVVSGSVVAGMDFSGTNIVSTSTQIENFGFVTNQTYGQGTASLQSQIDAIDSGVSLNDENIFLAEQFFTQGMRVTGSILLTGVGASFSGSGALLSNIPAAAIVGSVAVAATSLSDGGNSITANSVTGITITAETGSVRLIGGNLIATSGSVFSGSGAGLYDIPGSAIIGGVGGGTSIATGSVTASVHPTLGLIVNSDISASGDITARSISVGTSGTPTIYSNNNLNLSASNAVVITDSPLRLNPFTNSDTGSFSLSNGDLVYNSTTHDFYGYKSGSWVSLTAGSGEVSATWAQVLGKPTGLFSSSLQVPELGGGLLSSSAQVVSGVGTGDVLFANSLGIITSSASFRFTEATGLLNATSITVGTLTYTTLSGPAIATGSFNLLDADRVLINNDYELPTADGSTNQVIKAAGDGTSAFGYVSFDEITGKPSGLVTGSTQLVDDYDVALLTNPNIFTEPQTITGSLFVSSSTVTDILVLPLRDTKPTLPLTGSIIVSASVAGPRPFFYDGTVWLPMI